MKLTKKLAGTKETYWSTPAIFIELFKGIIILLKLVIVSGINRNVTWKHPETL